MDILYSTYRDFVATMLPDEAEWKRMPLAGKRSVEEVLQNFIKDMKDVGGIYNCDLTKLSSRQSEATRDLKYREIRDLTH